MSKVGAGAGAGYRLMLASDEVDAWQFERLLGEGRRLLQVSNAERALDVLSNSFRLWRGPALQDVAGEPFTVAEVARLEGLYDAARRWWLRTMIDVGRADEVVGELAGLVTGRPLDEGLRTLLVLALYHCGRVAEAGDVCQAGISALYDHGLEAPALRTLQHKVLRHEVKDQSVPSNGSGVAPLP